MSTATPPRVPPTGRDWGFPLVLNEQNRSVFFQSSVAGTLSVSVTGPYVNALLCSLPRSAGPYVAQLLALSLGIANHQIGFNKRPGDLYYPRLLAAKFGGRDTISHCQSPATPGTLAIARKLHLRPIVLWRNLLDALVSRRDLLLRDGWAAELLSPSARARFLAATDGEQLDLAIDVFAVPFLNFAGSWSAQRADPELRPIFATYEELLTDEIGLVARVAAALERPFDPAAVRAHSAAIRAAGGIHFAVGIAGRGQQCFAPHQIQRLRQLALRAGCEDEGFLGFALG